MTRRLRLLLAAGALVACGEPGPVASSARTDSLYAASETLWDSNRIPVCWSTGGHQETKAWVKDAVLRTWSAYADVEFVGWQDCTAPSEPAIRVVIADEWPRVTALGRHLAQGDHKMVLNDTFGAWDTRRSCRDRRRFCIEAIAVHEFGHALGFAHEQNRPDTPWWCNDVQGTNGDVVIGPWDRRSVMNYCNPDWNGNGELSRTDIAAAQALYSGFTAEAAARAVQLTAEPGNTASIEINTVAVPNDRGMPFMREVALDLVGLPYWVRAGFTPAAVTPGASSALRLEVADGLPELPLSAEKRLELYIWLKSGLMVQRLPLSVTLVPAESEPRLPPPPDDPLPDDPVDEALLGVTLTQPLEHWTLAGDVVVAARVSGRAARVSFTVDGQVIGDGRPSASSVNRFQTLWRTTELADGPASVEAIAVGADGTELKSEAVAVVIDNQPDEQPPDDPWTTSWAVEIVANVASKQSCDELCADRGKRCESVGTDLPAQNSRLWYVLAGICYQRVAVAGCGTVIDANPPGTRCEARRGEWTNCRCH